MMVGVVGLGLIGGSMARAINQNDDYTVYGYDIDNTISTKAVLVGATEGILKEDMIPACDIIILGLYPQDTIDWVKKYADVIKKDSLVMDTCGTKRKVCEALFPLAEEKGFHFVGAHPMAGVEHSGFEYSKKAMFSGASLILVLPQGMPIAYADTINRFAKSLGFIQTPIVTPEEHDQIIAFTSQLGHVVSSAYIKSPTAERHEGFSAGTYHDMTRVAKLKEDMWTELFADNSDFLAGEVDGIIERLREYSDALKSKDTDALRSLLKEGRARKLEIDKEIF